MPNWTDAFNIGSQTTKHCDIQQLGKMEEIEYLHLEDEYKEDILYFEKEDDKVITVTNILQTCSGFNDI